MYFSIWPPMAYQLVVSSLRYVPQIYRKKNYPFFLPNIFAKLYKSQISSRVAGEKKISFHLHCAAIIEFTCECIVTVCECIALCAHFNVAEQKPVFFFLCDFISHFIRSHPFFPIPACSHSAQNKPQTLGLRSATMTKSADCRKEKRERMPVTATFESEAKSFYTSINV